MPSLLVETLAASTAHGISRAAATKSIPLRVTWILLFLIFLGLFFKTATNFVEKLINVSIVATREDSNSVPFQLPDFYFCPTNSISGSYPFILSASEAALVNSEIEHLSHLYDNIMNSSEGRNDSINLQFKAFTIFRSMSREAKKLLLQRSNQSFLTEPESTLQDWLTSVLIESNQLCFKLSPGDFIEKYFQSKAGSNVHFRLDLFTDPYNAHLNYSGHKLNPITYEWLNQSALPNLWDLRNGIRDSMPDSGYSLIIVERGRMPSMFQRQLHMAPGRAYYISLSMEQVEFSKELYHVRCLPGNHSTHTEALFNKFLSDSMLRVYIGIESPKSPKLLISYSYSWSTFLADIGGLLGLYIGCSLLTLCELVELFYHAIGTALKQGQRGAAESHKSDRVSQYRDEEELVAMAT